MGTTRLALVSSLNNDPVNPERPFPHPFYRSQHSPNIRGRRRTPHGTPCRGTHHPQRRRKEPYSDHDPLDRVAPPRSTARPPTPVSLRGPPSPWTGPGTSLHVSTESREEGGRDPSGRSTTSTVSLDPRTSVSPHSGSGSLVPRSRFTRVRRPRHPTDLFLSPPESFPCLWTPLSETFNDDSLLGNPHGSLHNSRNGRPLRLDGSRILVTSGGGYLGVGPSRLDPRPPGRVPPGDGGTSRTPQVGRQVVG